MPKEATDPNEQQRIVEEFLGKQRTEEATPRRKFMRVSKVIGLIFGLIFSLVLQIAMAVGFQLSWGEIMPERRDFTHFVHLLVRLLPGLVLLVLPFWLVYRGFCTEEMEEYSIFGVWIRFKAVKRALAAETCIAVVVFTLFVALGYALRPRP